MRKAPSTPAIVDHVCPTCGPRLQAPPSMSIVCRCGRATELDVSGWVATARDHYPDQDPVELAKQVGIPQAQARVALDETLVAGRLFEPTRAPTLSLVDQPVSSGLNPMSASYRPVR